EGRGPGGVPDRVRHRSGVRFSRDCRLQGTPGGAPRGGEEDANRLPRSRGSGDQLAHRVRRAPERGPVLRPGRSWRVRLPRVAAVPAEPAQRHGADTLGSGPVPPEVGARERPLRCPPRRPRPGADGGRRERAPRAERGAAAGQPGGGAPAQPADRSQGPQATQHFARGYGAKRAGAGQKIGGGTAGGRRGTGGDGGRRR
ncbi:unnamed protein product, partial [Ectocarpus sp. 12 AP-2014]